MTKHRVAIGLAGLLALAGIAVARPHHGGDHPRGWEGFAAKHDVDGDGAVTREELAQSSEHFALLDANGDGRIVEEEMEAVRSSHVLAHFARWADGDDDGAVSAEEWKAFLAARDEDGDGELDLRMRHHRGPAGEPAEERIGGPLDLDDDGLLEVADLQALFARFDSDGDGTLSANELPAAPEMRMRGFGGPHGHMRSPDPDHLLARLDTDGNGSVSRAEWDAFQPPHFDAERHAERHAERFAELDTDGDGSLGRDELAAGPRRGRFGHR
jgi:Ca2+-binding EF-hand superfamily protein